jgi:hypothetical protein
VEKMPGSYWANTQIFNPRQIPNLALWLDGNDPAGNGIKPANGTSVATWDDKSGNGFSFTQVASGLQPLYANPSIGNNGSIQFNGQTNYMDGAGFVPLLNTENTSISVVANCSSLSNYGTPISSRQIDTITSNVYGYNLYSAPNNSSWVGNIGQGMESAFGTIVGPTVSLNTNTLVNLSSIGGNITLNVNATSYGTIPYSAIDVDGSITDTTRLAAIQPFTGGVFFFPGLLSEFVIYSSSVSAAQASLLANYLLNKWQI